MRHHGTESGGWSRDSVGEVVQGLAVPLHREETYAGVVEEAQVVNGGQGALLRGYLSDGVSSQELDGYRILLPGDARLGSLTALRRR